MVQVVQSQARPDVIVAGAGIAGLAAAQVLADAGLTVLVLEKSAAPGGKCTSFVDAELGHTVEHGIHGVFPRYLNLRALWRDVHIPDSIFSSTRTTGMAGADGRMHSTNLADAHGPMPFFLLGLVPKGVLRLRDYLFAFRFLLRTYAAATSTTQNLDDTTFGGLLRSAGVSERIKSVLLLPYIRNLTYARGDEVSAQVAVEALSYYVVEDADAVKAKWIDGGPSEVIFAPWQKELERRGVRFAFATPVVSVVLSEGKFASFLSHDVVTEGELGPTAKTWTQHLGHHFLGLRWQPETKRLVALNAQCTHKGCALGLVADAPKPYYQCPCHGAQFDLDGQVLHPPATSPLEPVAMARDASSGAWYVVENGASAAATPGTPEGAFAADFAVIAMDLAGVQAVLPQSLVVQPSTQGIPLLRTTSVMVLRMCFLTDPGKSKWQGPDSGVFAAGDILDNFFALHTFQQEFARRGELFLECHIGDSEQLSGLDDAAIFQRALQVLDSYFHDQALSSRFRAEKSRLLRHDGVFSLAAPGDLARAPRVSDASRPNLMFAGDWVQTDDPKHRGFFMERAAVTGIEAANAILRKKGLGPKQRALVSTPPPTLARLFGLPYRVVARTRQGLRRLLSVD